MAACSWVDGLAFPEILGKCVLASLRRDTWSHRLLAAAFLAYMTPDSASGWELPQLADEVLAFCIAAQLPGAVVDDSELQACDEYEAPCWPKGVTAKAVHDIVMQRACSGL